MARWKRKELEQAFEAYQAAALKGAREKDWTDWANCFTEDVTYFEHHYGRFWGRERVLAWISETMSQWPASEMRAFPVSWYSIDVDRGWVVCEVMNRMRDLGDGEIYQEPNITILHYAGDGRFKYEEDAYNPTNMGNMIGRWIAAEKALADDKGKTTKA